MAHRLEILALLSVLAAFPQLAAAELVCENLPPLTRQFLTPT